MALDEAALGVGRQVITHVVRAWLGVRQEQVQRGADLTELLTVSVVDTFHRRDLRRQLEQIGDQVACRLQPLYEQEFRGLPENERLAALQAVVDTLTGVELDDRALFNADVDAVKLARAVRKHLPDATSRAGLSGRAGDLYDVVLDESCQALVRIVQGLPAFPPRVQTELLARTSRLADTVGQVLDRMPRTSLTAPRGSKHDAAFRARYMEMISEGLDELELFGIDMHHYRPRTRVSVAYLSLTVTDEGGHHHRSAAQEDAWFAGKHGREGAAGLRVEDALAEHGATLLRGEAGSGKTTLLQWIAVNCARGTFTGPLASWNGRVPFLIRLRSYAGQPMPGHDQFLDSVARTMIDIMPKAWVHRQLDNGAVLLVDGVDELVPHERRAVRTWLQRIRLAHTHLPIVVTSRSSAASQSWLRDLKFGSVVLEPMNATDVVAFCQRWHDAVREATAHDPTALPCAPDELADYQAALLRHLDAGRHLRGLATNPLLCAMLCALNLDRRKHLPVDRMALYDAAVHLLLERRDAERDVPAAKLIQLTARDKIAVLQYLAWGLTLAGRAELGLSDVIERVDRALDRLRGVTADAATVARFLLERSGVIREPVERRVDFVHRTFQEYLAAKEATDDHKIDVLIAHAHSDQWRETIIMAVGHATPKHAETLLTGILDRADHEQRHARPLRLLAAACLDTAHTIHPQITMRIDAALSKVMPPRAQRETRSLALAGPPALAKLPTSLEGLSDAAAAASICTAALINGPDALRLLAGYASDPRPIVQEKIVDVWGYFDGEEYVNSVLIHAPLVNGTITVKNAEHVAYVRNIAQVTQLNILIQHGVTDLAFLDEAPYVNSVSVRGAIPLDLAPLQNHPGLQFLSVWSNGAAAGFAALGKLTKLINVRLDLADGVDSITFVESIPSLTALSLRNLRAVTNYQPLTQLPNLTQLDLSNSRVDPGGTVGQLTTLATLYLWDTPLTGGLQAILGALPSLTTLQLGDIPEVKSTELLSRAASLETLWLWDCPIRDISPLAELAALSDLALNGTEVVDLTPLAGLKHLQRIDLRCCPPQLDLTPLTGLPRRTEIWLAQGQEADGLDNARDHHRIRRI